MKKKLKNVADRKMLHYLKGLDELEVKPTVDRFEGALLFSAIGDALGWPTEFVNPAETNRLPYDLPIKDFVRWKKLVGGKWWGYFDIIEPGDYSDDTQLTLAVARCIGDLGAFEPDQFAYCELPLWLQYQRGGGRSIKTAARALIKGKAEWYRNFYKVDEIEYRTAGANGAAMRNLPVALASVGNTSRLIRDSIFNALITHGHPRGILATVLFGTAVRYALSEGDEKGMCNYLINSLRHAWSLVEEDWHIKKWLKQWESFDEIPKGAFSAVFQKTIEETVDYLRQIPEYLNRPEREYYFRVGALNPATKGSGIATVCCAIFLSMRQDNPENLLNTAVNLLGSDTDTIAAFLGALLGARYGRSVVPSYLLAKLQDYEYMLKTAQRLHAISQGGIKGELAEASLIDRKQAYLKILAWEIGLHEMFWDAIGEGGIVTHPTLGKGTIMSKNVEEIRRKDYVAKLLRVKFDCGQTCVFHSRVEKEGNVSESLARDIERALRGDLIDCSEATIRPE